MKLIRMHRTILARYDWYWDKQDDTLPHAKPVASSSDKVRIEAWYEWRYRHLGLKAKG